MLAIVCPGQGAQAPGLLAPWLELDTCRDRMGWFTTVAGIDLLEHGTESDAETIRDTAIAQPLIVASGLAALLELFPRPSEGFTKVSVGAGHSVGEITAAAATGVITAEQALVFVRERGRQMARAGLVTPTGMSAVIGGDADEVLAAIELAGLTAANMNTAGQVVAAGTLEQLASLAAAPPAKARVVPLPVAGAFHTSHMAPAVERLAGYARAITTREAHTRLVSNRDGHIVRSGREVLDRLVSQVSSPVRWDLCMQTMVDLGVTGLIEVPPAGTLVGLAKRAMPGVELLALRTPDDLEKARAMVAEHGDRPDPAADPEWTFVIAPTKGVLRQAPVAVGDHLDRGAVLAHVHGDSAEVPVGAPQGGWVSQWLVRDGDEVAPGQPVLRLAPRGAS
ncbi:MAG: acyltransferase domain-containing protein [Candidatus Phosphoribacter sp.]